MDNAYQALRCWGQEMQQYHIPRWQEVPDLELYMDQVVLFLEKSLKAIQGRSDGKIITPAMINNYVKLGVIAPPVKKRYSKAHLAELTIICNPKQTLSITDIQRLLSQQQRSKDIKDIYDDFCEQTEAALRAVAHIDGISQVLPNDYFIESPALKMAIIACAAQSFTMKLLDFDTQGAELAVKGEKRAKRGKE